MESFRYDPQTCSFKGWLMHVTRRRIIDHLRKRQRQQQYLTPLEADTARSEMGLQVPDAAAEGAFDGMWEEEWQKRLMEGAVEMVKQKVKAEHYQIFDLHHSKNRA